MRILRMLTAAVLPALLLTGCAVGKGEPRVIESDPDTRPVTERMAERYQCSFTPVSEDADKGICTLQDENGLECHVRRYLDDFGREDGSFLEVYCDDYYAVLVGETPEMKALREKRGAYLKSTLTGEYDDEIGRSSSWIIGCENYDDIADIYRETVTAAATAPSMLYGQQGHWSTLLPSLALTEPQSGEVLAITGTIGNGSLNHALSDVQAAFTEQLYWQGRRSELPDAAIRQCPQGGTYRIQAGKQEVPVGLGWDRHGKLYYIAMKWMDNDCGRYETPEALYQLCEALGCDAPSDSYSEQLSEQQLREFFGITLKIDPLEMTGTARHE